MNTCSDTASTQSHENRSSRSTWPRLVLVRTGHTSVRTGHASVRTGHISVLTDHAFVRTDGAFVRTGHAFVRTGRAFVRTGPVFADDCRITRQVAPRARLSGTLP